jgi:hypothetical protein
MRPSCAELTHEGSERSKSGSIGGGAIQAGAAFFDDAIMPVFCPTGQWHRGPRNAQTDESRNAQTIEMIIPGYCAWGCFSGFCLDGPS